MVQMRRRIAATDYYQRLRQRAGHLSHQAALRQSGIIIQHRVVSGHNVGLEIRYHQTVRSRHVLRLTIIERRDKRVESGKINFSDGVIAAVFQQARQISIVPRIKTPRRQTGRFRCRQSSLTGFNITRQ